MGEAPQWLYTVAFDEKSCGAKPRRLQRSVVSVDAFEPYWTA